MGSDVSARTFYFTSEAVSEGHPDKVCHRISDEVVDLFFTEGSKVGLDPSLIRVACETLATTNRIVIAGETRGPNTITHDLITERARSAIRDIGYEQDGFHWKNCNVDILLHEQSEDIAQGVDAAYDREEGAGDQGIMFGYACTETPDLMPAPIYYSQKILQNLAFARKSNQRDANKLGPDAKSQLSLRYEDGKPTSVTHIVLSTQHLDGSMSSEDVRQIVEPFIRETLPPDWITEHTEWHINPTGKFTIGGPDGDCGLTGRKIIVDTYGGASPHGGGAFSGKDPTKVDRSAAYAARYLAKNVIAANMAERCCIQLSYAIGISRPLSINVNLYDTGYVDESKLENVLINVMNLSPRGIREHLGLNRAIYARTAAYGHFGRKPDADGGFSWERTDLASAIKAAMA